MKFCVKSQQTNLSNYCEVTRYQMSLLASQRKRIFLEPIDRKTKKDKAVEMHSRQFSGILMVLS